MSLDRAHNFYRIPHCRVVERPASYVSCLKKIEKVNLKDGSEELFPECAAAIKRGRCIAFNMLGDEIAGLKVYYRDRDDCGPGILSREELGLPPRTEEERKHHHKIAADLQLGVDENKAIPATPVITAAAPIKTRELRKPSAPATTSAFDLGSLINEQVQELNQ
jgi:hypothetical protein